MLNSGRKMNFKNKFKKIKQEEAQNNIISIINKNVLSKDKNLSSYATIKTLKSQTSSVAPWRGSHDVMSSQNNPNFEFYIGNDGLMHSSRKQGPLLAQQTHKF